MLDYGFLAPAMFGGLIVFLLVGFPVAFSLAALGLAYGFVAVEIGYFGVEFLQACPRGCSGSCRTTCCSPSPSLPSWAWCWKSRAWPRI